MRKPAWITPQVLGLFRERADGDWDYFPFGRFGRGYRVRASDKDDMFDALFRFEFVLAAALIIVLAAAERAISCIGGSADGGTTDKTVRTLLSPMAFIGVVVLGILLLSWYVRRLVKNLPVAETRLTAAAEYRLWAARIPDLVILMGAVLGPLGCIGTLIGIWHVLRSGDWLDVPGLLIIAAVSGFAGWYYVQTWRHRPK